MLNLLSKFAFLISNISLGNKKLKLDLHSFMMSMFDVLKSFIKNLVTAKSRDLTSDFSNAKHSKPPGGDFRSDAAQFPNYFGQTSCYYSRIVVVGVRLEDSGNYTCEVRGHKSRLLATVTYLLFTIGQSLSVVI